MPARGLKSVVVWLVIFGATAALASQNPPQTPSPQVPTFRGRTVVVPVDVRVLDRDGKPVTDLKLEDFTIFENGVRQKIEFFSTQAIKPAEPGPDVTVRPVT